ncbi:MAG: hypothetical protein MUF01_12865 [Bryobacterales bacterium]|jgi:hypothetical protein|nr:hypothetical protein [Bryobacterales bacterium]
MDFYEVLAHLVAERKRIDEMIQVLETLQREQDEGSAKSTIGRRGRKSMGAEERKRVSERMRRYWAERRNSAQPDSPHAENAH